MVLLLLLLWLVVGVFIALLISPKIHSYVVRLWVSCYICVYASSMGSIFDKDFFCFPHTVTHTHTQIHVHVFCHSRNEYLLASTWIHMKWSVFMHILMLLRWWVSGRESTRQGWGCIYDSLSQMTFRAKKANKRNEKRNISHKNDSTFWVVGHNLFKPCIKLSAHVRLVG